MSGTQNITKLDAGRRQLATAIELWFHDKDEVSVLTLSYAAYEIIHSISEAKGRVQPLLLDMPIVPPQFRQLLASHIKKVPNFFKHADRDPDGTIEFNSTMPELFIMFSIMGLHSIGLKSHDYDYELAFSLWFNFNRPHLLTKQGREMVTKGLPVDTLEQIKAIPKNEFLEAFLQARRITNTSG